MAGDSIAHAKRGVALALNSLSPADRFAVIGFGSYTLAFDKTLQPANRKNLKLAEEFVDHLPNLGGTEMGLALELAMSYGLPLDILLLTDGECWSLGDAAMRAKAAGTRIFSVGIGSAVAEDTVRMLADETCGACELLTPNEDMATGIAAHFGRMRQPRILGMEFVWGQALAWTVESKQARFAGDSCLIWAELTETVSAVKAALQIENGPAIAATVVLADYPLLADALVRLAVAARLPELSDQAYVDWSLRFQLVTEKTDYFITMEQALADKAVELPELQVVLQMLAAGWGGAGSVRVSGMRLNACAPCLMPSYSGPGSEEPRVTRFRKNGIATRNRWQSFVKSLGKRASTRPLASLPASLIVLAKMGLPGELLEVLKGYVECGEQEAEVVHSAIDLIREYIDVTYPDKVLALLTKALPASSTLVQSIRRAFDALDPSVVGLNDGAGFQPWVWYWLSWGVAPGWYGIGWPFNFSRLRCINLPAWETPQDSKQPQQSPPLQGEG